MIKILISIWLTTGNQSNHLAIKKIKRWGLNQQQLCANSFLLQQSKQHLLWE